MRPVKYLDQKGFKEGDFITPTYTVTSLWEVGKIYKVVSWEGHNDHLGVYDPVDNRIRMGDSADWVSVDSPIPLTKEDVL